MLRNLVMKNQHLHFRWKKKITGLGVAFLIKKNKSEASFVFNRKECCDQLVMPVLGTE